LTTIFFLGYLISRRYSKQTSLTLHQQSAVPLHCLHRPKKVVRIHVTSQHDNPNLGMVLANHRSYLDATGRR
jgi:hypothetical protein